MGVVVLVDKQLVYGDAAELGDQHLGAIRDELGRLHDDIERLTDALKAAESMLEKLMKDAGVTKKSAAAAKKEDAAAASAKKEDAAAASAAAAAQPREPTAQRATRHG